LVKSVGTAPQYRVLMVVWCAAITSSLVAWMLWRKTLVGLRPFLI
jgi:hypothetical protein